MKNLLNSLLMLAYGALRLAFAVVVFCVIWKITQHFWPLMNSVLRLVLAVAGGVLALPLIGQRFSKPERKTPDE